MVLIEKSFPRGGTKKSSLKNETKTKKTRNIVFGARQEKKQNKTKKQKPEDEFQITENVEAISAELLTYKTIQEGMILMGYVEDIKTTHLKISLPGRMTGKILVSSISNSYNKVLNDVIKNNSTGTNTQDYTALDDLFEIGQKLYTKVVKIHENTDVWRINIELSVKPEDVHSDLTHENVKKGMIFHGAIEEIQEHGYVIETGIKNLRCFLPLDKLKIEKNQKQHSIGQLVCIKIIKLTKDKIASTGVCKLANSRKIKDLIDPRIEYILPTMIVHFTVTKILKNGLQGTIMNGSFTAYCNELYLSNKSVTMPTDYEVNSTYKAQVLYVMPITKLVYVSLNLLNEDSNDNDQAETAVAADDEKISLHKRGDVIVDAKVDRITTGGIILTLDEEHQSKGIISFKSIKSNLLKNYDQDELLSKYYKNSKHKIRILGHYPLESLYLCTDNERDVNEKYFILDDFKIGEFVTAIVENKHKDPENGGYYVTIGKVRGFIEKIFLWPTTKNLPKSTKIHCRILAKDTERNIVYVTNRPELMNKNAKILKKLSDIKKNRIYPGIIVKCGPQLFVVKFFNNIKGILYRTYDDLKTNKFASFYEGQIMLFCITSYDGNKLLLSLVEDSYKIGEIYSGRIDHIIPDVGLDVKLFKKEEDRDDDDDDNDGSNSTKNSSLRALIPQQFITEFPELQQLRLQTFKINDTLPELICMEKNLFSLRDVDYYKMNPSILLWSNLKVGDIIRGVVRNILNNEILEIFIPVKDFNGTVKVHMNMMLMNLKKFNFVRFHEEQICYVKILSKTRIHKLKTLTVSGKLTDVWNGNLLETGKIFGKYLNELKIIRESMTKSFICKLNIGQICSAKVLEYEEQNQRYRLSIKGSSDGDNEIGVGMIKRSTIQLLPSMKNKQLKIGSKVKCIVLWIDYVNEIVYLSPSSCELEKRIVEGVALPENLIHKNNLMARILLVTSNVIVCSLKKGTNPLILVPKRLHYNDFENSAVVADFDDQQNGKNDGQVVGIKEGEFCRLSIIHETISIGIFDNVWRFWNAAYKKNRKRKISENDRNIKEPVASKKSKMIAKLSEENEISTEIKEEPMSTDDEANKEIKSKKQSISGTETEDNLELRSKKIHKLSEKRNEKNVKSAKMLEESMSTDDEVNEDIKSEQESSSEAESEGNHLVKIKNRNETRSDVPEKNLSLPGLSNFWSTNDLDSIARTSSNNEEISSSSSDNDEDNDKDSSKNKKKQKKRLTAAEKFQMAGEEEQRLRAIEEKLANPHQHPPETVDQFERLILSNPNDSKIWINYMVHHLQATEIDKAKQVGRKALKTISFREEQELLNIWIALLNLELLYGTKDTFNDVLKESLLCNEPYKVYMRVLRILAEAKKVQDLCDVIGVCIKRFKDKPEMWKNAATAYFDVDLMDKGKQLLHRALKVLPEREHVNTIVTFANLNHKYGDKEISHALYEQILTSYPKRVDIWSQYIDILIKDQDFESARRTLDRAIVQKLPLKKMRTLFKKYLDFEEKYGTEENVLKVKEMAANYVQKEINIE